MGLGYLIVKTSMANDAIPIKGANVVIKDTNGNILHTLTTDISGKTEKVQLFAPDKIYDQDPCYKGATYSTYRVEVNYPGYITEIINGVQIFDTIESLEPVNMHPIINGENTEHVIDIPPHKQILDPPFNQQGPIGLSISRVLQRVIIPEYITVHLGRYTDTSARNVRVPFPFYVKNVTSSEIYPTWPEASLEANIRAIINFALNRVYTEWYRSRNYNFDITSSTTTDMYYVDGRDIFTNISYIVDSVMGEYLRRPNHNEPFFTEFCNGTTATCPGMSQWGTVTLAERGFTPIQILRYYYPNDLSIYTAPIAAITESYPGIPLSVGTQGPDVELMQKYLNRIRQVYSAIPNIPYPNAIYGTDTANAVRTFQQVFDLPQTGIIDRATWNKISFYYVSITKLAELTSEGDRIVTGTIPPNVTINIGASGGLVSRLQFMLDYIAQFYSEVPELRQDGAFGTNTRNAVIAFQNRFGLTPDGIVGPMTWAKLYEVYNDVIGTLPPILPPPPTVNPPFPGTPLTVGSRGENVLLMQRYLNRLSTFYPSIPRLTEDGIFGPATQNAVIAFQRLFGLTQDGIIGRATWDAIVTQYDDVTTTPTAPPYPGTPLRQGSTGENVRILQTYINRLAATNSSVPTVTVDGNFGPLTANAVRAAQRALGLTVDGIVGPITWAAIVR
ncbi:MAG: peptidoglycan-binding protein [Clostridiales bacterium]|jgi:peptidoglycan hydrolase-like protein with peptidoglycan-binding domain|nr:peptidoglycan-binding protein [Clostridiales bacterium]